MKLTVTPKIVDNRYSVVIAFKQFGSADLTSAMEEKIIDDYAPKFKLSDLTFERTYAFDEGSGRVVPNDEEDTSTTVKLTTPNREVAINSDLELGYTVHIKEIADNELENTLDTKDKVAQAKVQLFVDVITSEINKTLKNLATRLNDFEDEYDVDLG